MIETINGACGCVKVHVSGGSLREVRSSFMLHISSCEMSSSNERTDRKVVPQSIWFKIGVDVVIG